MRKQFTNLFVSMLDDFDQHDPNLFEHLRDGRAVKQFSLVSEKSDYFRSNFLQYEGQVVAYEKRAR